MVAKANIVWFSGVAPGVLETAEQLRKRGFDVRVERERGEGAKNCMAGFATENGGEEVPSAVVYFVPRPAPDASVFDVPTYTGRIIADFVTLAKGAVSLMARERRGGAIVSVCDIAGIPGRQGHVAEATVSGAMIAATKCLAKELGRQNISANALCYGFIPALGAEDNMSKAERKLFDMMHLGNSGSIEHVVENLEHLINNRHFMTGQVLHVDNGLIM